ncbi:MAG: helix-turn-helix domain-containing GNAT family N-acetyltransferase [Terriglobales bacterium]|jgi:DNA-binding MarR family transcriptional regulator/GNAT superfamily N-acetyltransferase
MNQFDQRVAAVREFNRFYTRQIGVLREKPYKSPLSLTEVRVLYELAHRESSTATELCDDLGLDPGYLSRVLTGFDKRGWLKKKPCVADGRQSLLSLTPQGTKALAPLDTRSREEVGAILTRLSVVERERLIDAMNSIESLLGTESRKEPAYILRPHQPGDMGWVVHRHGVLYAQDCHYDERFEALVAEIVAKFIQNFDPKRERCWIAEKDGEIVGSVFLVKHSKTIAKLRLLLVERSARGLGIGKRLVSECLRFARQAGYKRITLWTQSSLHAARGIYENAGFRLVEKKKHHSWGQDQVAEIWELKL